ncbi:hypothetical protein, partial [Cytobacillus sp. AMY 15.2]|uniref:hypothetical protein n=1 Tax=Cytobacillus sp. AMY 15.2 TaxID=2939563 RepID=UPI00203F76AA
HFKASWYLSNVLFACRLQDSLILPRGYFFVQTPFSFITGMLPRLLKMQKDVLAFTFCNKTIIVLYNDNG